jgi:hypothetical protein
MNLNRHSEIAERAYHIWEREGRPQGKALDHWLEAEAELAVEPVSQTAPPEPGIQTSKSRARRPSPLKPRRAGRTEA